jgi:hypothetical protein
VEVVQRHSFHMLQADPALAHALALDPDQRQMDYSLLIDLEAHHILPLVVSAVTHIHQVQTISAQYYPPGAVADRKGTKKAVGYSCCFEVGTKTEESDLVDSWIVNEEVEDSSMSWKGSLDLGDILAGL